MIVCKPIHTICQGTEECCLGSLLSTDKKFGHRPLLNPAKADEHVKRRKIYFARNAAGIVTKATKKSQVAWCICVSKV